MKDPLNVFLVLLVKKPPREVPNATEPRAKQARFTTSKLKHAQSVHKGGHRKSWMPQIALDAHLAPPHWPTEAVRCVLGAILAPMATPYTPVFVHDAHPVSFKTSKAKSHAPPAQSASRPTTNQRRVKIHLGALVKLAMNTCMTWDLETNGRAKRALQVQSATQILAGPPCKSWKAIGSYLGTRSKSRPLPNARFPPALQPMGPIVPPVPSVWSVAFATPIFIALQLARVILVRRLPPRHEWGPWSP